MFNKTATYLKDVRQEMSKVSWPTKDELIESTGVVLLLSGILAVYMFLVDSALNKIVQFLL